MTEYNLSLAIAAVFILLAVSLLGSTAPLLLSFAKPSSKHSWVDLVIKARLQPFGCIYSVAQPPQAGAVQRYAAHTCLGLAAAAARPPHPCPPAPRPAPLFLPRPGTYMQVGSFAGTGVILATALVHVLLPASEALTSDCLPAFWQGYEVEGTASSAGREGSARAETNLDALQPTPQQRSLCRCHRDPFLFFNLLESNSCPRPPLPPAHRPGLSCSALPQ